MRIFNFFKKIFHKNKNRSNDVRTSLYDPLLPMASVYVYQPQDKIDWNYNFDNLQDYSSNTVNNSRLTKLEFTSLTQEQLNALNAERRTPEGKAKIKQEKINMWTRKLEEAKEELKKLGVDA